MSTATFALVRPHSTDTHPSFASACDVHLDGVYRYLLYLVRHPQLAEDLTADTFERALKSWASFDPRRGGASAWLTRIARNAALDHMRADGRRRRREALAAVPEAVAPTEIPSGFSPDMRRAFERLTGSEREVIALRVILEFDTREAAAILDIKPSACTTALHRAMTKLREELTRDANVA